MAAAFLAIAGACQAGDAIIAPRTLYGGTLELFSDLERMGISIRLVDEVTAEALEGELDDSVRLVFAETISNPRLSVLDTPATAAWCHEHGLALVVDNTLASPALARPLELGADVVVESVSKQISGSGTVIGGVICDGGKFRWDPARFPALAPWQKFGPFAFMAGLRKSLFKDMGACMAPTTAFLCCVGLETLSLRMERACANALELARWLDESGLVSDVGYLGLASNPWHGLAERQFDGRYGALLTFRAGSRERAFQFLNRVRVALLASNIGDVRTLVLHPASTIFLEVDKADRERAGIFEDTVGVSVGIEDIRDLISDFNQALSWVPPASTRKERRAMAKIDNAALKKGGFMAQKQKGFYSLRLHITGGHLEARQLVGISKVADEFGHGYIHLTSRQAIEIPFINVEDAEKVKALLAEYGVEPGCCGARVRTVTACQGSAICPSGNIDSYRVATMLDERYFGRDLPGKFKFGVTGCQNNCLKAEENDMGVKGGRKVTWMSDTCIHCGICSKVCAPGAITDDGERITVDAEKCVACGKCSQKCPVGSWDYQTVYNLTFGGLFGNHITRGRKILPPVESDEQLLAVADATIQWYDDHAVPGDRFKFCLDREGWESFVPVVQKAYDEAAPEGCPKAASVTPEPAQEA
ncbi:MAG: PLP-dependent transferase [Olsenella sp.]|jgi:O-acetylhomoserine/O-acetylserine sulfhydrylase-like pyridoxal-dependent enzyme/dissimilatory sulfite reductase (desulfoviridin) alpha/beta subunit|nr:PLP-dependent transferase [Olsenella sp.]